MDRHFPLGRPRRPAPRRGVRAVVVLTTALLLTGGVLGPAAADREDDLEHRADRLGGTIDEQQGELVHSSRMLQRAAAALRSSQARLGDARDVLAATLGQLVAAQELDDQMQQALDRAERRLARAEAELTEAETVVEDAQLDIERFAVQSYATSDPGLISMDAVLDGDSPLAFTELMSSAESVVSAQTATMDELDAARIVLGLHEQRVQDLRNQVALKRRLAADNLDRKQSLAAAARADRRAVQRLVEDRRDARQQADQARRHDLRILQQMEREQQRVRDMLDLLRARQLARQLARQQARQLAAQQAQQEEALPQESPGVVAPQDGGVLDYPVPGAYVTSAYGLRFHPVLHYRKLHDGTDFGAGCGTPIVAPADGVVVGQYYNAGYGNRVILAHGSVGGEQLATSINHLSAFATHEGETVARGEVIGYVGTTGYSTGCHLHFMVYVNGATVDPVGWL